MSQWVGNNGTDSNFKQKKQGRTPFVRKFWVILSKKTSQKTVESKPNMSRPLMQLKLIPTNYIIKVRANVSLSTWFVPCFISNISHADVIISFNYQQSCEIAISSCTSPLAYGERACSGRIRSPSVWSWKEDSEALGPKQVLVYLLLSSPNVLASPLYTKSIKSSFLVKIVWWDRRQKYMKPVFERWRWSVPNRRVWEHCGVAKCQFWRQGELSLNHGSAPDLTFWLQFSTQEMDVIACTFLHRNMNKNRTLWSRVQPIPGILHSVTL